MQILDAPYQINIRKYLLNFVQSIFILHFLTILIFLSNLVIISKILIDLTFYTSLINRSLTANNTTIILHYYFNKLIFTLLSNKFILEFSYFSDFYSLKIYFVYYFIFKQLKIIIVLSDKTIQIYNFVFNDYFIQSIQLFIPANCLCVYVKCTKFVYFYN